MTRRASSSAAARRALRWGALPAFAAAAGVLVARAGVRAETLCGIALLAAPFADVALARRLHPSRRGACLLLGVLAQLAGLALLDAHAVAQWAAATCQALARARVAGAAALAGLLALGLAVAALRDEATPWTLAAPFLTSLGVVPGLLLLGADAARARARRARAPGAEGASRSRAALRPVVLAWPLLFVLLALSGRVTNLSGGGPTESVGSEQGEASAAAEGASKSASEVTRWGERMSFGEGVGRLSDEVVLWVAPRGRPERALYLAVLALDTFDERGLGQPRLDGLSAIDDRDDGRRDGWVRLQGARDVETLRIEVVQRPLRVGSLGGGALVRLEPLLGVELEQVLYERDTALVLPGEREGLFRYAFEAAHPDALPDPPPGARARHPDARYTQLPPDSPTLARLAQRAAELTAEAEDDAARVELLLRHFTRDFVYSLEGGGFAGVEGVADFLEQRAGYCTSFAATAVLLLRTRGIACRAVGGYLADDWNELREAHAVRGRNAHAWIEVHFEGLGWRTFDPTPVRERERAFQRRDGTLAPELGEWSSGLAAALGEAARGGADGPGLARLGARLAQAPAVLRQELGELAPAGRGTLLALVVVAAALLVLGRRSGRAGAAGAEPPRWSLRPRGAYARLLEALARRGWRPAPSESLRAFARRVEAAGVLAGFVQVTEAHLAERFGGLPPDDEARARARTLLDLARGAAHAGA